jgi:hypothetical protein
LIEELESTRGRAGLVTKTRRASSSPAPCLQHTPHGEQLTTALVPAHCRLLLDGVQMLAERESESDFSSPLGDEFGRV